MKLYGLTYKGGINVDYWAGDPERKVGRVQDEELESWDSVDLAEPKYARSVIVMSDGRVIGL